MNEILEEFKNKTIRDIEKNPKLLDLDEKIAKVEAKLTGLEFRDKIFKFRKRIERLERNKFGYDFSTNDDGQEN